MRNLLFTIVTILGLASVVGAYNTNVFTANIKNSGAEADKNPAAPKDGEKKDEKKEEGENKGGEAAKTKSTNNASAVLFASAFAVLAMASVFGQ